MPASLRLTTLLVSSLVLARAWAGPTVAESDVDRAIDEANAMVKLGVPSSVIDQWLLHQVKGGGDPGQDSSTTMTTQTPPPAWDVYATAAWTGQERAAGRGAELQKENVYIAARLGASQADEGVPDGQPEEADVDQRGAQATHPLHAANLSHRTDDVRVGAGGPARQ